MPGLNFFYKRNATHGEAENFAGAVYHVPWGFPGICEFAFLRHAATRSPQRSSFLQRKYVDSAILGFVYRRD